MFVYADIIYYPIPVRGASSSGYDLVQSDTLLRDFSKHDSQIFDGKRYSTAEPRILAPEYLDECFGHFADWAVLNYSTLHRWLICHHSPWIEERRFATIGYDYTFSLDKLMKNPRFDELSRKTGVSSSDICYAFDSILKFPLYGELVGNENRYFNHPIRDAFRLPTMQDGIGKLPRLPLTFKDTITKLVPTLSRQDYVVLLHELREVVRQSGLHRVSSGSFDKTAIRDIASRVALPPRLTKAAKVIGVAGILAGGLGAFPALGSLPAIAGAVVSVSATFWEEGLPRGMARIGWLRWAQTFPCFPWLVREEIISTNPFIRVKVPKPPKKVIATFSDKQLNVIFKSINTATNAGFRDYTIILMLLDTGLRASELVGLTLDNVNLEDGMVKVFGMPLILT